MSATSKYYKVLSTDTSTTTASDIGSLWVPSFQRVPSFQTTTTNIGGFTDSYHMAREHFSCGHIRCCVEHGVSCQGGSVSWKNRTCKPGCTG